MSFFRSKTPETPESIDNNFDNCQNRIVEFTDFVKVNDDNYHYDIVGPTTDLDKDLRKYKGSSAELHCPKTNDERVTVEINYRDGQRRELALANLKREAGMQVCRSCVYAPMSPLEVAQYDAHVARTELEKVELLQARTLALAELAESDPAYRNMI